MANRTINRSDIVSKGLAVLDNATSAADSGNFSEAEAYSRIAEAYGSLALALDEDKVYTFGQVGQW